MTKIFATLALAMAIAISVPVMAHAETTNVDHWSTKDQCFTAVSAGTAVPYLPGKSDPQSPDVAKGERLLVSPTGWCNKEFTKYGLQYVFYSAEQSVLQRGAKYYDPRCNNWILEIWVVPQPQQQQVQQPQAQFNNGELARLEALVASLAARPVQTPTVLVYAPSTATAISGGSGSSAPAAMPTETMMPTAEMPVDSSVRYSCNPMTGLLAICNEYGSCRPSYPERSCGSEMGGGGGYSIPGYGGGWGMQFCVDCDQMVYGGRRYFRHRNQGDRGGHGYQPRQPRQPRPQPVPPPRSGGGTNPPTGGSGGGTLPPTSGGGTSGPTAGGSGSRSGGFGRALQSFGRSFSGGGGARAASGGGGHGGGGHR